MDLEDVRLGRVAQRRCSVSPVGIASAFREIERSRENGKSLELPEALLLLGLISERQKNELRALRDAARPAGLKLVAQLGRGASATVYSARTPSGRLVAVKVFRGEDASRDRRRIERELDTLARVGVHDAIPRVRATGASGGRPFVVMDLVEGRSLGDRLGEKLSWQEARRIAASLARVLSYVHEQGVVHRDVKPGNVMLREDGEVALIDFGLACATGTEAPGRAIGTPGYISPELARGEAATPASDVYSMGALLYFLVTGEYVLDAPSSQEMIQRAARSSEVPKPVLELRPDLPARFAALIDGCLAKRAYERPTLSRILRELDRVSLPKPLLRRRLIARIQAA